MFSVSLNKEMLLFLEDCLCIYKALLAPGRSDGFVFMLCIQEFIRYRSVSGEYEHSIPKNRGPLQET
jgi:hypothetical protein